jgi:hypothetical protein
MFLTVWLGLTHSRGDFSLKNVSLLLNHGYRGITRVMLYLTTNLGEGSKIELYLINDTTMKA